MEDSVRERLPDGGMRRRRGGGRGDSASPKRAALMGVAVLVAPIAAGCPPNGEPDGPQAHVGPVRVTDAAEHTHVLSGPAVRVVSLVPSATETMKALGVGDRLVGRTDHDAPWTDAVPSVGGGIGPSVEAIVALAPDIVIRFEGRDDAATAARLGDLGVRTVAVRPSTIAGLLSQVRLVGAVTGVHRRADSLITEIEGALADIRTRTREREPLPSVAFVLPGTPPWVAGADSYVHELIDVAGGRNVFADLSASFATVSPEELLARSPEVVLVSRGLAWDRRLAPDARVVDVGERITIPGPEIVDVALFLEACLSSIDGC